MAKVVNLKRYSEAFKSKVMEEFRQGKWATSYAVAKAYGMRPATVRSWIDAAGLTHLRGRTVEVKTLGEASELKHLRRENRRLRDQLLDEVLACRLQQAPNTASAPRNSRRSTGRPPAGADIWYTTAHDATGKEPYL